jgi:hypothetical protein
MGRSKGSRTMSWMEYRTLWGGVSVALILRFYSESVETKRGNGAQGMVRAVCKEGVRWPRRIFSFCLLKGRSDGHA